MRTETLRVRGMSCSHCVQSVEGALKKIGAEGKADLASGSVQVRYDETKVSLEAIKSAIEEQGYEVQS